MKTVDLFDLLTFEQREQVAEIFLAIKPDFPTPANMIFMFDYIDKYYLIELILLS